MTTVVPPPVSLNTLLDIGTGLAAAGLPSSVRLPLDGSPSDRSYARLLTTEAYEAWLLVWPPGSLIDPHDHGDSHGVFVVVSGELTETRGGGRQRRVLGPGEVATVPVGVVHGVEATGRVAAASVHVYSPPLTEMRFYNDDGSVLSVEVVPGA